MLRCSFDLYTWVRLRWGVPESNAPEFDREMAEMAEMADQTRALADGRAILEQVAFAVAHCHAAGIAHRDVKPENVRLHAGSLEPDALHAVLLDWGCARRASACW